MSHYDDDTLALLALGEPDAAADGGAHLKTCGVCQAEVATLAQVVAVGRSASAADVPSAPAPEVWARVQAQLRGQPLDVAESPPRTQGTGAVVHLEQGRQEQGRQEQGRQEQGRQVQGRQPRRRGVLLAVAASLVGLAVGAGITYAVTKSDVPSSKTVAAAPLTGVSAGAAHGQAVVGVTGGQRTLTISISDLPPAKNGFYEVWLMNAVPARFLAVGVLDAKHHGVFQIPAGLDLGSYPYVDVSLQPFNGSPLHSTNSVVRGSLHA